MTRRLITFALAFATLAMAAAVRAQEQGGEKAATPSIRGPHVEIAPYIEAAEVLTVNASPYNDTVSYTTLAAGVDASATGRNSAASASLRYERHFSNDGSSSDSDTITGIGRASIGLGTPNITLEAGALASRSRVDGNGTAFAGALQPDSANSSRIYSFYTGPSVQSRKGPLQVEGYYRFGYTKVESPSAVLAGAGSAQLVDLADESTTHSAQARVGVAPDTVLPVIGVGIGGGWNEQDTSNLDQRVRDRHLRADVTVPVSMTVALVGGVGYEDVEVSSRDALRDPVTNAPVIGANGRYVTDKSAPRVIAYQTDGLIWDAGVMWRPSHRTSLEAFVGKRYDSTTYYGSFAYAPNSRESLNVSVYDGIQTFGGLITDRLAGLPAEFQAIRSPFSGQVGTCVATTSQGGSCIGDAYGSLNSVVFRSRGISLSYGINFGRTKAGIGYGYDRRKYIAAPGTVLGSINGIVDEQYWATIYGTTQLDERSSLSANAYGSRYTSGLSGETAFGYSATVAYYRRLIAGLTGTAALGLDGITQDSLPDVRAASALLGLRYTF